MVMVPLKGPGRMGGASVYRGGRMPEAPDLEVIRELLVERVVGKEVASAPFVGRTRVGHQPDADRRAATLSAR